ncbi:hypothetical protein MUK42_37423, partial [Musa troglodytarum]
TEELIEACMLRGLLGGEAHRRAAVLPVLDLLLGSQQSEQYALVFSASHSPRKRGERLLRGWLAGIKEPCYCCSVFLLQCYPPMYIMYACVETLKA